MLIDCLKIYDGNIVVEKIRCRKYFVRLIFVALCDYKNFSTTKIFRFR